MMTGIDHRAGGWMAAAAAGPGNRPVGRGPHGQGTSWVGVQTQRAGTRGSTLGPAYVSIYTG